MPRRCCRDSLKIELEKLSKPFIVGLEVPCRWCADFWVWNEQTWFHSDDLPDGERAERRTHVRLVEARAKRYDEILGR